MKKTEDKKPKKPLKKVASKKLPTSDEQIKADIKKAVEKIPELIVEHLDLQPLKQFAIDEAKNNKEIAKTQQTSPSPVYNSRDYQTKKNLMILAVIILSSFIFGMWAWNAFIAVEDINRVGTKQPGILSNVQQSFKAIMNNDETNLTKKLEVLTTTQDKTNNEAALKKGLTSVINNIIASSTNSATGTKK